MTAVVANPARPIFLDDPAGPIFLDEAGAPPPPRARPGYLRRAARGIGRAARWLVGWAALVAILATLADGPIVQLLTLGYVLEGTGRVARSGRWRDGWPGVDRAARLGSIVAGAWICLLPARLVASVATSASLIDPGGPVAGRWRVAWLVVAAVTIGHIGAACLRGGRIRDFAWPPGTWIGVARRAARGGAYAEARDRLWDFATRLHLPRLAWVGLRGGLGTLAWLAIPVGLLMLGRRVPVVGFLGALGLMVVVPVIPFAQARFAATGRLRAFAEVRAIRDRARRAPWATALAFLLVVAASIPLYLLKIERVPRDVAWLPGLFFVLLLVPARLACGWAYARGGRRERPRSWFARAVGRVVLTATAAGYVLVVWASQFTTWGGLPTVLDQHAFLIPAPNFAW